MDPKAEAIFKERGIDVDVITGKTKDELIAMIGDYDGLAIRSATKVTADVLAAATRSEEHTSELQSLMRTSYAVFCLKKKTRKQTNHTILNYTHQTMTNN